MGFVIRDSCGKVLLCGGQAFASHHSVLVAEAWALVVGIKAAKMLGVKCLVIEGDNLCVI